MNREYADNQKPAGLRSIAQPSRDRKGADDAMAIGCEMGYRAAVRCKPPRRIAQPRQRGIVLILVVAVLGILFVSGVALLTTVTFAAKNIEVQKADRQERAAVRAIESAVNNVLRDGFLGTGGKPYNAPPNPVLANGLLVKTGNTWRVNLPVYGEIPGLNTIISLTEPEEDGTKCELRMYTHLTDAMNAQASTDPQRAGLSFTDPNAPLPPLGLERLAAVQADGQVDPKMRDAYLIMDADGDGIPDSYAMKIGDDLMSPDLRRALADRLRDPRTVAAMQTLAASDPNFDPDTLWLTLKVVPHGAMVNINSRMRWCGGTADSTVDLQDPLVASVLQKDLVTWHANPINGSFQDYLSSSEEWALRYRGGNMIPRNLSATRLVSDETRDLLGPHRLSDSVTDTELLSSEYRRWWQYDTSKLANYSDSAWRQAMDTYVDPLKDYDLTHLITTVSYDDQLIRSGNAFGKDWVEKMMESRGDFEWDNYPHFLDDQGGCANSSSSRDPRLGRLKFSFPYFSKQLSDIDSCGVDPSVNGGNNGWLPQGLTLRTISDVTRAKLARIARDAFSLMLRNYIDVPNGKNKPVFSSGAPLPLSLTAASLAANMLDFADQGDEPAPVPVVFPAWASNLPPPNITVYGLERQPYITEIYASVARIGTGLVDQANSSFAIELYNPYDTNLDLTWFELVDQGVNKDTSSKKSPTDRIPRLKVTSLKVTGVGTVIPGAGLALNNDQRFKIFYANPGRDPGGATQGVPLGEFAFDSGSVITLVRVIDSNKNGIVDSTDLRIPVDRIDAANPNGNIVNDAGAPVSKGLQSLDGLGAGQRFVSIQRDTSVQADLSHNPGTLSNWRFVVPKMKESVLQSYGTPGAKNNFVDPSIASVHVDFSNAGTLRNAFPTTGSMLLLMRHAHVVNASDPDPPRGPKGTPFNYVGNLMAKESAEIDNGRMPVFDTANSYHLPSVFDDGTSVVPDGSHQGVEGLPWGQLIYDYFTALPLRPSANDDACSAFVPPVLLPRIDEDGLRVSGRIDLNAAPWSVLSGLPVTPMGAFSLPTEMKTRLQDAIYRREDTAGSSTIAKANTYDGNVITEPGVPNQPSPIGRELAQAIVAYRDARAIPTTDSGLQTNIDQSYESGSSASVTFGELRGPSAASGGTPPFQFRRGYGFLTVGELLNVRPFPRPSGLGGLPPPPRPGEGFWKYSIDGNAVAYDWRFRVFGPPGEVNIKLPRDYISAVSRMVALGDWVTTKSHVFTVYGTIRGQFYDDANDANDASGLRAASLRVVDQKAIRFQTTVDRLPMLFGRDAPERIGSLIVERYSDLTGE